MTSLHGKPDPTERDKRSIWWWLVQPSGKIQGREARRQARLLSSLLVVLTLLSAIGTLSSVIINPGEMGGPLIGQAAAVVILGIAYGLSRTRRYGLAAGLTLGILWAVPFLVIVVQKEYDAEALTNSFIWAALPLLMSSIFLPMRGVAILAAADVVGLLLVPVVFPGARYEDIADLAALAVAVAGVLLLFIRNRDVLEKLRQAELVESNRELQVIRTSLEQRVVERTRDLERRAHYLEATATVARDAEEILDLQRLLSQVASLISQQFGFYHAGIFLLDESGRYAVLRAASSEGGHRMLERGHRLQVGGESIVGHVTAQGTYRIALEVGKDAVYFQNPDLPETRSEIALPLRARGEVIGALDVQSVEPQAFSTEDVAVLQALADQVALAISNARLFEQAQEALEAERRAYGGMSRQAWTDLLRAGPTIGYHYDENGVTQMTGDEKPAAPADKLPERVLPVKAHEAVIGKITVHKPAGAGDWTADEAAALETMAEQLGIALEGAQLYQETQRRAARERVIREVSDQIQRATSMESLMHITAEELNKALGGLRAYMRLGTEGMSSPRKE